MGGIDSPSSPSKKKGERNDRRYMQNGMETPVPSSRVQRAELFMMRGRWFGWEDASRRIVPHRVSFVVVVVSSLPSVRSCLATYLTGQLCAVRVLL
jgi:hypothetical protein